MKDKLKTETHYFKILKFGGTWEDVRIIQEENVKGRNAIKLDLYLERWRTPEDTVKFLEKVTELIKENFI